ncbi:DUF2812 domain-containing protein [Metabacillus fastidiosus]|uniref:DUF2812 domain-containing protein n=1 Tax=Metabacillus fastidiosus TaxID=1458 RepID=UPI0008241E69|nr:DUF2812 domain-containing protein [Metabacillus fastidiosus]MED4462582.1 DUF2812 domain-containing protein [Metabacillus fastidiosus]
MKKKAFKLFWTWKDDAEEKWLFEMSKKGWALRDFKWGLYTFEKIRPAEYIYKLDYKSTRNNDLEEYLSIFEDAGWEHVAQFFGWHYFRIKTDQSFHQPDIYSDIDSKVQKYKVLSNFLIYLTLILITIFFTILIQANYTGIEILRWIYLILIGFNLFAVTRLRWKIKKVRNSSI